MPTTKSEEFKVKSYNLLANQSTDMVRRVIELVSEEVIHGIIFKVTLVSFTKNVYGPDRVGQMKNFGASNFNPIGLAAWIDPSAFDSFYAILSSESPLIFVFEYIVDPANPKNTDKDIWSVSLKTDVELPGDFEKSGVSSKLAEFIKAANITI